MEEKVDLNAVQGSKAKKTSFYTTSNFSTEESSELISEF